MSFFTEGDSDLSVEQKMKYAAMTTSIKSNQPSSAASWWNGPLG